MGGQSDEIQNGKLDRYFVYTVVGISVLAGLYIRLAGRGDVHLFGDEFHSVWNLNKPYSQLFRLYDIFGSGVALPVMQRVSIDLFGPGLWAYRFAATVGAVGALLLIYPVARRLVGQTPAIIATLALSASSIHIFYSRFGRSYSLVVFLSLLLVYAMCRVMNGDKAALFWRALLTLSAGLLPWVHLTAAVFVAGVAIAGALMIIVRKQNPRDLYWLFTDFAIASAICIGLYLPAWKSLWEFVEVTAGRGNFAAFGVLDVSGLLAGNRPSGSGTSPTASP
jgi:4-amino-4-deoxy-L-arabinose transferase-like glycosyltransferase